MFKFLLPLTTKSTMNPTRANFGSFEAGNIQKDSMARQPSPETDNGTNLTHTISNRASKFPDLYGFLSQHDLTNIDWDPPTSGSEAGYPAVGQVYYINHPEDAEIDHRIVVIFRTNNDSWSCYGFYRYARESDTINEDFRDEHVRVGQNQHAGDIVLNLEGPDGEHPEVGPHIWINCRQMLDIKHTVAVVPLGCIQRECLDLLWCKGRDVFDRTFADMDKRARHRKDVRQVVPPPSQSPPDPPVEKKRKHTQRSSVDKSKWKR